LNDLIAVERLDHTGGRNQTNLDGLAGNAVIDQISLSSLVIASQPGTVLAPKIRTNKTMTIEFLPQS
jgi:hypothetical protein